MDGKGGGEELFFFFSFKLSIMVFKILTSIKLSNILKCFSVPSANSSLFKETVVNGIAK